MTLQPLIAIAPEALIILIFVSLTLLITWRRRPRNTTFRDLRGLIIGICLIGIALLLASLTFAPPLTKPPIEPSEIPSQ